MNELADFLDRFNRKERNLLIRDALGHSENQGLPLTDAFRQRVGKALDDLDVPVKAWWATDYHLNWIAGALAIYISGEQAINNPHPNDLSGDPVRGLIERNQEDVDLLIAFDQTLILIEVKAFGYFTNRQINSKVQRWRLLKKYADSLSGNEVTLRFMLMSRVKPVGLNQPPEDLLQGRNEWPHAVLEIHSPSLKLKVTGRKPGAQSPTPDQNTWFIVPALTSSDDDDDEGDLVGPV